MVTDFARLKAIFDDVVQQPRQQWDDLVQEACDGDAGLAGELWQLLEAHEQGGSLLDEGPFAAPTAAFESVRPGAQIGLYKLLEQIGEGGMGVVYMAEQSEPVHRRVAIKVIKPGMDSRQVIARFEAERQALAMMDHPNIAKVLEAGTLDPFARTHLEDAEAAMQQPLARPAGPIGRPYFVMELVKGVPLTQFCDERKLSIRQRLELFVPVCQAIQHAHQKGIIHRDIKPTNVLVAMYDGVPVPKVIDFGVAKAMGPKLTEKTMFTAFGQLVGTLEYMSPEQAQLNQLDIDTRSDIYSLGVLLYELLTGTTPLDKRRLSTLAFDETLRLIREEEPPKPSTCLSASKVLPTVAANRHCEPARLAGLVRGELDWIVMKALEKDRNRRYETANSFAHDVLRYLADEPVLACPPSVGYRLRKFIRRHRVKLTTAALLVLAMLVGTVVSTWLAVRATIAEREAQGSFHELRQAVDSFFVRVSDNELLQEPSLEPLRKELLQEALSYYEDFVRRYGDDPALRADLAATHLRIAQLMYELGGQEDWLPPLQKGVSIVEALIDEDVDLASVPGLRAERRWFNSAGVWHSRDIDSALQIMDRARRVWERLVRQHPEVTSFQGDLATIYLTLGYIHSVRGPVQESIRFYEQGCDLWRKLSQAHPDRPHYRMALGMGYLVLAEPLMLEAKFSEAEDACRLSLDTAKGLVDEYPKVAAYRELLAIAHGQLAFLYVQTGRIEESESSFREQLSEQLALLEAFPNVPRFLDGEIRARLFLSEVLWSTGKHAEATEMLRPIRTLAEDADPMHTQIQDRLAWLLATGPDPLLRDPKQAVQIAERLVEVAPENGNLWGALGAGYFGIGDNERAVAALHKAKRYPWIHRIDYSRFYLARSYWRLGEKERARSCYDEAVKLLDELHDQSPEARRHQAEARRELGISEQEP